MRTVAFRSRALAALALSGCITSVMAAPPQTINFAATSANHSATFSFSTSAASVPDPFGFSGSWYQAISLVIDNVSIANPIIGIYDQWQGVRDVVYIWGNSNNYIVLEDGNGSTFSGSAIFQLIGKTLTSFSGGPNVDSLKAGSSVSEALTYFGPPLAAVPEPSAALMALAGLGVLGAAVRRRQQTKAG